MQPMSPSDESQATPTMEERKTTRKKRTSNKNAEDDDKKKKKTKMTLSKEQDMMLIDAVRQYTEANNPIQWKEINRKLFNNQYTSNFLYQRYHRTLNAKKHRWSDDEDLELLYYCQKHEKKWSLIATKEYEGFFPDIQLSNRYKNVCKREELKKRLASMTESDIEELIENNKEARTKSLDTRNMVKVLEDSSENTTVPPEIRTPTKRKSSNSPQSSKKTKYKPNETNMEVENLQSATHSSPIVENLLTYNVDLDTLKEWPTDRIEEEYWKKLEFLRVNHYPILQEMIQDCETNTQHLDEIMQNIITSSQNPSAKLKQIEDHMDIKNGWSKLMDDCTMLTKILQMKQVNPALIDVNADSLAFLCRAEFCLCTYREKLKP